MTVAPGAPVPGAPVVAVPGKLFLAGEYAVLEGGPAILTAVGRTAIASFIPGLSAATALVAAASAHARAALTARGLVLPEGAARVDTSTFMRAGTKLGLGSSAAAAVAAVAAAFAHAGLDLGEEQTLLRATADTAHRAAQGGVGSGADIAASVRGGFLRFTRQAAAGSDASDEVTIQATQPPAGLHMVTFWTRSSARTTDFIGGVERLRRANPAAHSRRLADLLDAANAFAGAFATSAKDTVTAAAHCYAALAALGLDAGLPIVVPAVAEAALLAKQLGGAAKPSGAGGGDMGIGFFSDKPAADAFVTRCPAGVLVLDIPLGAAGAALCPSPSVKAFKKD